MTSAPHRPVAAPSGHRRAGSARRALGRLGALGVAAFVLVAALSEMGGTYAMWSDQQSMDAGTLTAGTAELDARWRGDAPKGGNLLPGKTVTREAQLHNVGDVPLALSAATTTAAVGFEVRAAGTCDAARGGPATGATAIPLLSGGGEAVVLQPDQAITTCIAVTATPALVPGTRMTYTLDVEGRQVR